MITSYSTLLDTLLAVRSRNAYGEQGDYFDHANCIAWTRSGDAEHPGGVAVVMSNADGDADADAGVKQLRLPLPNAIYHDTTRHSPSTVTTDSDRYEQFVCPPGSLSLWICSAHLVTSTKPDG